MANAICPCDDTDFFVIIATESDSNVFQGWIAYALKAIAIRILSQNSLGDNATSNRMAVLSNGDLIVEFTNEYDPIRDMDTPIGVPTAGEFLTQVLQYGGDWVGSAGGSDADDPFRRRVLLVMTDSAALTADDGDYPSLDEVATSLEDQFVKMFGIDFRARDDTDYLVDAHSNDNLRTACISAKGGVYPNADELIRIYNEESIDNFYQLASWLCGAACAPAFDVEKCEGIEAVALLTEDDLSFVQDCEVPDAPGPINECNLSPFMAMSAGGIGGIRGERGEKGDKGDPGDPGTGSGGFIVGRLTSALSRNGTATLSEWSTDASGGLLADLSVSYDVIDIGQMPANISLKVGQVLIAGKDTSDNWVIVPPGWCYNMPGFVSGGDISPGTTGTITLDGGYGDIPAYNRYSTTVANGVACRGVWSSVPASTERWEVNDPDCI